HKSNSQEEREGFGFQFEKNPSGASLDVGIASAKDTGDQWENTNTPSNFKAGKDVRITAGNDVTLQAADVLANRDVNVEAGNNITLETSYNTSNAKEKHEKSFAGVTTTVNVGALDTVQGLKDSADRMNDKDGSNKVGNTVLTGLQINHLFNKGKNFVNWLSGNTGARGNTTAGFGNMAGNFTSSVKDALANTADASSSVTVGFKTEKTEASVQTSTAVTDSIEGRRSVNVQAHKGSIYSVGADIIAGTNSDYALNNDAQSGNINLQAGNHITFESAQNTQSTQNHSESASVNVGTSYGTG
ncbi:hemagglutinin repeat-containing protein, partial [Bartonella vinsonii]